MLEVLPAVGASQFLMAPSRPWLQLYGVLVKPKPAYTSEVGPGSFAAQQNFSEPCVELQSPICGMGLCCLSTAIEKRSRLLYAVHGPKRVEHAASAWCVCAPA